MKKIFVFFALFCALIFATGCGGGSNGGNQNDYPDSGDTVTDGDVDSGDSGSADTDPSDSGHEDPDTTPEQPDNGDSQPDGGDTVPDNGDSTPDEGGSAPDNGDSTPDEGDSADDSDDGDTGTNPDTNLPECSPTSATPCTDAETDLIWSGKAPNSMQWKAAVSYCDDLTEGGYSDWHLPNISELRTLIQNCRTNEMPDGSCGIIDTGDPSTSCLSYSDCWIWDTCCSCDYYTTGKYSKFGDTGRFGSSSNCSDLPNYAWDVGFNDGGVESYNKSIARYVRCVR
ncbi:DUF1566 domain-containing protein [bacterium]|nr:DUF1566 domain-containing protein [bacterium]